MFPKCRRRNEQQIGGDLRTTGVATRLVGSRIGSSDSGRAIRTFRKSYDRSLRVESGRSVEALEGPHFDMMQCCLDCTRRNIRQRVGGQ